MTLLSTASYYEPQNWRGSAFRVSRGYPRGRKSQWSNLPSFYPDLVLLRAYRHREIDFESLTVAYIDQLEVSYVRDPVVEAWLTQAPELGDFTLLCFEREGVPCHRRVLARWLKDKQPALDLATTLF